MVTVNTHQLRRVPQTLRSFRHGPQLLAAMLAGPGRGPATLTFCTRGGLRLTTPNQPGARVPVFEVFAEDVYDLSWFLGPDLGSLPRDLHCVDIGAHVGCFAVALTAEHPGATVACFEPTTITAEFARQNVRANGLVGRVTVAERAVAARVGSAEFVEYGAGSALNGLLGPLATSGRRAAVTTTTFDQIVAEAAQHVSVVKIDCEGGEYDVVLGSSPISWATVQRVVLEYHPHPGHTWTDLRDWFAAVGLQVVRHCPLTGHQGTLWLSGSGAGRAGA